MTATLAGGIDGTGYHPGDAVSATPALRDAARGDLAPATALLVDRLCDATGPVTIGDLSADLDARFGIGRPRADSDVAAFVAEGQRYGLLSFHARPGSTVWSHHLRPALTVARDPLAVYTAPPGGRQRLHPARFATMVLLTIRSMLVVALATGLLAALVWMALTGGTPASMPPSDTWLMINLATGTALWVLLLGTVHEVAHYAAARALRVDIVHVFTSGLRVGLAQRSPDPGRRLAVTVAGPAAALALAVPLAVGLATTGPRVLGFLPRPLLLTLAMVTVYHVLCLVPPSADGRALTAAVRRLRASRTTPDHGG